MCCRKSVSSSSEISRCSFSYYVPVTTASRLPFVGAATSVSTLYSFKECHSPADWRRGHRDHYRYVFFYRKKKKKKFIVHRRNKQYK